VKANMVRFVLVHGDPQFLQQSAAKMPIEYALRGMKAAIGGKK
jgi:hypothetical protein